ncbi:hypothetical protein Pla175_05460 [Pirellulimonas nuda]|uniref:Uncharacterized protein n=1 Tax=Pirellulimonas nuda TaxID=2528009 RepID=A0A518D6W3_9BACT|nr:hypothetical protein [Pirellulimonas nuda]QDU87189.1 hypothetical protein Pla175_05460 [Pirellulimonas nuda]
MDNPIHAIRMRAYDYFCGDLDVDGGVIEGADMILDAMQTAIELGMLTDAEAEGFAVEICQLPADRLDFAAGFQAVTARMGQTVLTRTPTRSQDGRPEPGRDRGGVLGVPGDLEPGGAAAPTIAIPIDES